MYTNSSNSIGSTKNRETNDGLLQAKLFVSGPIFPDNVNSQLFSPNDPGLFSCLFPGPCSSPATADLSTNFETPPNDTSSSDTSPAPIDLTIYPNVCPGNISDPVSPASNTKPAPQSGNTSIAALIPQDTAAVDSIVIDAAVGPIIDELTPTPVIYPGDISPSDDGNATYAVPVFAFAFVLVKKPYLTCHSPPRCRRPSSPLEANHDADEPDVTLA
mmetsp:Transcript_27523/g.55072  ORF Transcript_27523/g.55072 Transcript_27523/m.55072 type:complete len:216 (+) Transcript_27523:94-741(+)